MRANTGFGVGPVTNDRLADLSMNRLAELVSRPARSVTGEAAGCRTSHAQISANDWTPEYEEERVPARLAAICAECPLWQDCLVESLRMNDIGYRASMTTKQRRRHFADIVSESRPMVRRVSVASRPRLMNDSDRTPTHALGAGSLNSYRRGCRCDECRGYNAAARRRERARAS